ncbi:hypothetical protein ACIPY5_19900 [Microbacterium sp. NPDC089698]|uniref:hypothetical protein n=1 Tax=Microbacterium sp. NPDC089698 TaxID=3364200 RepID=UPI00382B0B9E
MSESQEGDEMTNPEPAGPLRVPGRRDLWLLGAGASVVATVVVLGFFAPDLAAAYEGHPNIRSLVAMVLVTLFAVALMVGVFALSVLAVLRALSARGQEREEQR